MRPKTLSTVLAFGLAVASAGFADKGHGSGEIEISELDTIVFCNSHKSGEFQFALDHGVRVFGSLEAFYKNLHRVQCPPYYPSPLYHSVEEQPYEKELITELENIGRFLTLEERQRLLNCPDEGRRKVTILGMADISYRRTQKLGPESARERYEVIRRKLVEIGAKRVDEMTAEELVRYD